MRVPSSFEGLPMLAKPGLPIRLDATVPFLLSDAMSALSAVPHLTDQEKTVALEVQEGCRVH